MDSSKNNKDTYIPSHKDLPILDAYFKHVFLCSKNAVKDTAKELKGVNDQKVYRVIADNKKYIEVTVRSYLKEADIDKLRVLSEIKNIAYSNLSDYGKFKDGTMSFEDWSKLSRAELACVKDVKITFDKFSNKNVHFVLYDKQSALRDLVKILDLSHDVVEHKGNITFEKRLFDD